MAINLSTILGLAPQGSATAWCNFNGTLTGTNAARSAYNVSSVTRNSAGNYTVTFTTAYAGTNYAVTVGGSFGFSNYVGYPQITSQTTANLTIICYQVGNLSLTPLDAPTISIAVFGTGS
jgi:hypothetical protein